MLSSQYNIVELKSIFTFFRGKNIQKVELSETITTESCYPVYSSKTKNDGVLGYTNNFSFSGPCFTWTTDGLKAGTLFNRTNKFTATKACGIMLPKSNITLSSGLLYLIKEEVLIKVENKNNFGLDDMGNVEIKLLKEPYLTSLSNIIDLYDKKIADIENEIINNDRYFLNQINKLIK